MSTARIEELTDDIAANRVPGGSAFARAAAELIALRVADLPDSAGIDTVRRTIADISRWTADTKPSMAVVRNVADLAQSVAAETGFTDAGVLRAALDTAMRGFMSRSERAVAALGDHVDLVIGEGSTVLIHSYSASLEAMLRAAVARKVTFRLLVTESRPYRESRRLIEAVVEADTAGAVDLVVYSDAGVCIAASEADVALIGADTVYSDGSFANKTGSMPLALACRDNGVPLYVATELAKVYFGDVDDVGMELRPAGELSEGWSLIESGRVRVWNQFFERVPGEYVHRYLTEGGLVEPDAIRAAAATSWPAQPQPRAEPTTALENDLAVADPPAADDITIRRNT
jgi:translation initiation factor 2B subunit (eIF-2B alpha/beta/delta family)